MEELRRLMRHGRPAKPGRPLPDSPRPPAPMCDAAIKKALRNSHASDLETQGKGIAECMESLEKVLNRLDEIPTRSEVREMIVGSLQIHVDTCDKARDDAQSKKPGQEPEHNRLKLLGGKFGLEAEGTPGKLVGLFVGLGLLTVSVLVVLVAKGHILDWLKSLAQ